MPSASHIVFSVLRLRYQFVHGDQVILAVLTYHFNLQIQLEYILCYPATRFDVETKSEEL